MNIDFDKNADGLVPAIVQDANTLEVLMLGYMNREAYEKTVDSKLVTFYSRSRKTLWTKGESSGNFLNLVSLAEDCDGDTLLVKAIPSGPVCHTGSDTCFDSHNESSFLFHLEKVIQGRKNADPESSYTAKLFKKGVNKIAQKVGEEATECVIEAVAGNNKKLREETADLIYHLLVLLAARNLTLADIAAVLRDRHKK